MTKKGHQKFSWMKYWRCGGNWLCESGKDRWTPLAGDDVGDDEKST